MTRIPPDYFNPKGFGMFSRAGDSRVATMVKAAAKKLPDPDGVEFLTKRMQKICGAGHTEVYDTAVREAILNRLKWDGVSIFDI